jgi:hypothetical protein
MMITFSLFWVVIKNNVLYVVRTGDVDGGGLFFPSAINQTFTGLYFMEACLVGLFFLVRDVQGNVACEAQGIIMAVVLVATVCYQIWLTLNFSALFQYAPIRLEVEVGRRQRDEEEAERLAESVEKSEKPVMQKDELVEEGGLVEKSSSQSTTQFDIPPRPHFTHLASSGRSQRHRSGDLDEQKRRDSEAAHHILARLNRPLDESRLAQLEEHLEQVEHRAGHIGHALLPRKHDIEKQMMNDPISKIIMQHNDELEDLDAEERDMLISVAFTHPILREPPPAVWIPSDDLGVSDDEVRRTRAMWPGVGIENRGAFFNKKLKVEIDKPPPDMSEFALIMAEL